MRKQWSVSYDKPRRVKGGGGAAWLDRLTGSPAPICQGQGTGGYSSINQPPDSLNRPPKPCCIYCATWQPSWRASLLLFEGLMVMEFAVIQPLQNEAKNRCKRRGQGSKKHKSQLEKLGCRGYGEERGEGRSRRLCEKLCRHHNGE